MDQMGRRYLVQGGLPYNPKTKKIDLNILTDEAGPFLANIKKYIIVEHKEKIIELVPEPEEIEEVKGIEIEDQPVKPVGVKTDSSEPLYVRQERERKRRLMERKAKKKGRN